MGASGDAPFFFCVRMLKEVVLAVGGKADPGVMMLPWLKNDRSCFLMNFPHYSGAWNLHTVVLILLH